MGKKTVRELNMEQLPEQVPGLVMGRLLRMEKEMYGIVRGTAIWRETMAEEVERLGNQRSILDLADRLHRCTSESPMGAAPSSTQI